MSDLSNLEEKKQRAQAWFRSLRDAICAEFEMIEDTASSDASPAGRFIRTPWEKSEGGGGGEISIMKGRVFEKVGVNISTVTGEFSENFRKEIPGASDNPSYWASGISLVAHMCSPKVPAVHFNTRMIVTGEGARLWFGGGGDLNPMREVAEDTTHFHESFKRACDEYDSAFYPAFKAWCDEYFYIPHRQQARGVGGIFYDYLGLNTLGRDQKTLAAGQFGRGGLGKEHTEAGMNLAAGCAFSWDQCFAFTKAVGEAFIQAYVPIAKKRMHEPWSAEDRAHQLMRRGLYAEYNLLYDRGTRFGLMTGGNPEAILMSLPPLATWA